MVILSIISLSGLLFIRRRTFQDAKYNNDVLIAQAIEWKSATSLHADDIERKQSKKSRIYCDEIMVSHNDKMSLVIYQCKI